MKKVFIYEANSLQALAISKFIKENSDFFIVGGIEKNIRFDKKNYDEIIIENFEKVNKEKYDYLLPMGAYSTHEVISKFKTLKYENGIRFNEENLIVFDKPKMLSITKNLNIPMPKTWYKKESIQNFPIFYKEDFENGGGNRGIANRLEEIPLYNNLIFQEYISTPSTYGVGFLAKDGEILTYTIHREVISFPIDGGSSVVIEKFEDTRLLKYTQKLIKEINYNGWGLSEYKYCNRRKDFVFMEINGKFWASIEFMLLNNPNLLKLLLNIEYQAAETNRLIFINRFFAYSLVNMINNISYFFNAKWKKESSLSYQLVRKIIPNRVVDIIKKVFS